MSRALDDHVKRALEIGDHRNVFGDISIALSRRHGELMELELLGASHRLPEGQHILQDGSALAIPKIRLVQAFIVARTILTEYLQGRNTEQETVLSATSVILLMDPEHLTAANTRKRIIEKPGPASTDLELLHRDKYFLDSLLTSRLHRHTKSPTLWSHRRWLMERLRACGVPINVTEELRRIVFVSGERHPRNYYAWCHARYLVDGLDQDGGETEGFQSTMVVDAKKWCLAHHDDVSGWMFLLFLLARWPGPAASVFSETLKLVESFQWRNESVWYFLRNMLAGDSYGQLPREEIKRVRISLLAGIERGSQDEKVLQQALQWTESVSHPSNT